MQSCLVSAMSCDAGSPSNRISFLISRKNANFFFCLYFSGVCFYFFKLRGLSSKSSSNRIQCCSCFLIIYCTFIFCITIISFCLFFSDMNYFVYFICLLCLTSLTTTMLDSYDVSETLNNFFEIHRVL